MINGISSIPGKFRGARNRPLIFFHRLFFNQLDHAFVFDVPPFQHELIRELIQLLFSYLCHRIPCHFKRIKPRFLLRPIRWKPAFKKQKPGFTLRTFEESTYVIMPSGGAPPLDHCRIDRVANHVAAEMRRFITENRAFPRSKPIVANAHPGHPHGVTNRCPQYEVAASGRVNIGAPTCCRE